MHARHMRTLAAQSPQISSTVSEYTYRERVYTPVVMLGPALAPAGLDVAQCTAKQEGEEPSIARRPIDTLKSVGLPRFLRSCTQAGVPLKVASLLARALTAAEHSTIHPVPHLLTLDAVNVGLSKLGVRHSRCWLRRLNSTCCIAGKSLVKSTSKFAETCFCNFATWHRRRLFIHRSGWHSLYVGRHSSHTSVSPSMPPFNVLDGCTSGI